MRQPVQVNGNLIGILGGVILSSDSVFIRLMDIGDSWLIVVLRGLFMWAIVALIYLLWPASRSTLGKPWLTRKNVLPAFFFCLASACFVNALNRGSIATVLVIISSTPFVSAIISRILFGIRPDKVLMLAALAGIAGVAVVMSGQTAGHDPMANYFALATAVSMALAFIFASKACSGTLGLPSLGGILASIFVVILSGGQIWHGVPALAGEQWLWVALEGAVIMPLAMGLIALSARFVSPVNAGLFLLLETALAPLWVALFLHENPSPQAVAGGVIIVLAVVSQTGWIKRRSALA
ncbi:DMT family transporter [Rahnella sp. PCH160]|uniref:DMT family transporter n=1 Tax=Rahnella sp. PCH160 TaxID=3447928 RepID=UPI0039FC8A68